MGCGGRPKKDKNIEVLGMGLPIVENFSRHQESILAYLEVPKSMLGKKKANTIIFYLAIFYVFFPVIFPH